MTSAAEPPPSRSAVWMPSLPSSPASSARRSSFSGARSSSADVLARGLDQDQVAGAPLGGRDAQERLALLGREALGREHDGLAVLEPLRRRRRRAARVARASSSSSATRPASSVLTFRSESTAERSSTSRLEERVQLRRVRAGDDQQAAGRVAQAVGRAQHAAVDREVGGPRRAPSRRGRSEDQPVRSSSAILTLRPGGLLDMPPSCRNRRAGAGGASQSAADAAISASFAARGSRLMRASSRIAALRSAIARASTSSTGRREAV